MNRILMGEDDLPEWIIHDRTVLRQKDPQKGNTADNYRPITCLPLMWKPLTGMIAEEMYNYLEREDTPIFSWHEKITEKHVTLFHIVG